MSMRSAATILGLALPLLAGCGWQQRDDAPAFVAANASTAIVADSAIAASRADTRRPVALTRRPARVKPPTSLPCCHSGARREAMRRDVRAMPGT